MEVFEAVRTMLAVRVFRDQRVSEDIVRKIVQAAHLTGSGGNKQPWRFIAVEDRETLGHLGAVATSGPYISTAAFAVVVLVEKTPLAVSDASRAVQSMMLTAWSEGIGSNWVGFGGFEDIKALLGIPAELDVLTILPFGYPAAAIGRGKKNRKPLSDVAFRERYGHPFA
jgi:nitroreductase